ncbi:cytochrome P450 family protein [Pseudonocardia lacus]|uniref:cytochrome P450 family protein n=1 Tax=Pseudonocardia lacus TaxID=2835865 RepID=UPI001BDD9A6C|nr:cytochrome P450 [Pseudonocardia lacus]
MTGVIPTDPFTSTGATDRHVIYDALVGEGPVHRFPMPNGVEGWLVTGYAAARAAMADPALVKGGPGHGPYTGQLPPDIAAAIDHHLLTLDPPDHTRLRTLVSAAFTRRRCELMGPRVQELTDELIAGFADADEVDLVSAFAYPLPISVICELLGIPDPDRDAFRAWTGPLVVGGMAGFEAYSRAAVGLVGYLRELLERKRREPADDLLSALVAVRDGGDGLTEDELTSMVFLLLVAGHETTVNLIANGMLALLDHPRQLADLRAHPERTARAVEELLRYDPPLQSTIPMISATATEIAGTPIPAGELVVVSTMAANRDPARRPGAGCLDLARADTAHLSFGHGVHHCLGAPLARLEGRIALRALVTRFPGMRLAVPTDELTRPPGLLMNGLNELPVRLR